MRFDLTTCIWGQWHINIMNQVMLPTLLAPNNLPELTSRFEVRFIISTTHAGKSEIEALPIFPKLCAIVKTIIQVDTEEEEPGHMHHVNWYHTAIQKARTFGAICVFVPPDVAWSNGTFSHMSHAMGNGKLGTAMPYLRVISETCLPELISINNRKNESLHIPPGDLVKLGMQHLHPLTAAAMAKSQHGRPSLEMLWRIPGEGVVMRHIVRELFSFDPTKINLTHLWYAGGQINPENIHIVTDSDDMFMLSFAPLLKDIPLYLQNHEVTDLDIARSSLHPLNDTPLNDDFPRHRIRLHYGPVNESKWRRTERLSDIMLKRALVMRKILQIWRELKNTNTCNHTCQILAIALQTSSLARRWPVDTPCTAIVPTDRVLNNYLFPYLNKIILNDCVTGFSPTLSPEEWTLRRYLEHHFSLLVKPGFRQFRFEKLWK